MRWARTKAAGVVYAKDAHTYKTCAGGYAPWRPPDAPKRRFWKKHGKIPGGGDPMRTELGNWRLEEVLQQPHCPVYHLTLDRRNK